MLNQTVLTGNLGQDPEIFFTSEGDPIAKFLLAFKGSRKKTCWIKVACFGRLAEITEKHLHSCVYHSCLSHIFLVAIVYYLRSPPQIQKICKKGGSCLQILSIFLPLIWVPQAQKLPLSLCLEMFLSMNLKRLTPFF